MGGDLALSGVIFRISAAFLVAALILLALSLRLSDYYLGEQQRLATAEDTQGAMDRIQTAERLDPFSSSPLQAESALLQQQGRSQEAAESLEQAIEREPNNYLLHMSLGFLQMNQLNNYEAASESFRKALELNPNSKLVADALAQSLLSQGKYQEAEQVYERMQEEGRASAEDLYTLGRIYIRDGEPEQGLQALERARSRAEISLENSRPAGRAGEGELLESIDLSVADALVIQGQYDEAYQIVAASSSDQSPAILALLESDPGLYRQSIQNSEIY